MRISKMFDICVLSELSELSEALEETVALHFRKKLGFSVKIFQTHSSSVYVSYFKKYKEGREREVMIKNIKNFFLSSLSNIIFKTKNRSTLNNLDLN